MNLFGRNPWAVMGLCLVLAAVGLGCSGSTGGGTGGGSATGGNSGTGGSGGNSGTGGNAGTGGGSGFGSVTKTVTYTEPTKLEGNACAAGTTNLTDLDHTTVYYTVNGGAPVVAATVPASAAAGGGNITQQITFNKATSGTDKAEVWVTATNKQNQESTTGCSAKVTFDF